MTHHLISIQSQNLDRHPCQLSRFSYVQVFVTPWTVAHQASLFMAFSRQEYWSGLPFPSPVIKNEVSEMSEVKLLSRV